MTASHSPASESKSKTPLLDALNAYDKTERLRFHVPGHNGKLLSKQILAETPGLHETMFRYDLTELEGLDVLSEPEECLLAAQQNAALVFGVGHSFFLVNGASVGLTAGLLSTVRPGEKILLPRNIHRSVISALVLTGAVPVWILPDYLESAGIWGSTSPHSVQKAFQEHPDITAMVITSPTYEGIGSDIRAISDICHRHQARLIVDEAHGSLWPFHNDLPHSACHLPCDLVIHSLHKTAGSLTQSAIAHLPHGSAIAPERFQEALNTLQTTSPSYLLLASLEASIAYLDSPQGKERINQLLRHTQTLRKALKQQCQTFQTFTAEETAFWDPSKLWIQHPRWAGNEWAPVIEAHGTGNGRQAIAYENATPFGALYLCGLGLEETDYRQFLETFCHWDSQPQQHRQAMPNVSHSQSQLEQLITLPNTAMSPRDAFFAPGQTVTKNESIGKTSKQTIVHCPPGVAVLMPGEAISAEHLVHLPESVQVVAPGFC